MTTPAAVACAFAVWLVFDVLYARPLRRVHRQLRRLVAEESARRRAEDRDMAAYRLRFPAYRTHEDHRQ